MIGVLDAGVVLVTVEALSEVAGPGVASVVVAVEVSWAVEGREVSGIVGSTVAEAEPPEAEVRRAWRAPAAASSNGHFLGSCLVRNCKQQCTDITMTDYTHILSENFYQCIRLKIKNKLKM